MLDSFVNILEKIGWKKTNLSREHVNQIVDKAKLLKKLCEINQFVPRDFIQKYVDEICKNSATSLLHENKEIFKLIHRARDYGKYKVDFLYKDCKKNDFTYSLNSQIQTNDQKHTFPLDLILFINHLPLIIVANRENKERCFQEIEKYKLNLWQLYKYNLFSILRTKHNAFVGTITDKISNYLPWRPNVHQLLSQQTLLDIFHNYVVFPLGAGENNKIMARYYQYYCAKKILASIKEKKQKGGVIWHTTGSGKSLTMIFSVGKILTNYPQSTILIVTDRKELHQQLHGFFTEFLFLIPHESTVEIQSIQQLVKLLKKPNRGKVIFTILHKFQDWLDNNWSEFKNPDGVFVFIDEAHRSQNLKIQENRFGYARIMRQIFPEAYFFAWTGTPINTEEKSTYTEFGSSLEPLHAYSTKQAIDDKVIINQIFYQHYPLPVFNAFPQMINKIKADYENLRNQKKLLPKFLVMVKDKREARKLYELFIQDNNYKKLVCLIISSGGDTTKNIDNTKEVIQKFKKNNFPNIAIVVNMLTTGFDLPTLRVIYIAKKINSPSDFWQRISRVNRLAEDKKVGHVVDFAENKSTLKEAKKKYFGSGALQLISSTEIIADCLVKLRQILTSKEKSSNEEIIGYLLKNKKEREFKKLVKKIEEVVISPQKEINENDNIFFLKCRKIAASFSQITIDFLQREKDPQTNKNLSSNKSEEESKKNEHIYDEENYHLYALVTKLKKLQNEFLKLNIKQKTLEKLDEMIRSYEERNPEQFNLLAFQREAEVTWKLVKKKYEEIQKNLEKDCNYLLKNDLWIYLKEKLPEHIETSLVYFIERLVESFQQAFHNNPDCFLLNETYGTAKLEKLFDKIYFEECNLPPPKSLQEKQEIRKNIINIIGRNYHGYK